ncbi:MAG TPA: ABC transporter permease [Vicinamibacterales bacterium]|nr:ABC transporter permease [Vicinamibacterales bacterium]
MDFRRYIRDRLPPMAIAREPEIVDELAQHLGDLYAEARAAGFDHEAAFSRAIAALPESPQHLVDEIQTASRSLPGLIADRWRTAPDEPVAGSGGRFAMFTDLTRDIRYAARMMMRTPGFTLVVALTMALGIGATSVIFTAVDALLLRSAPVADPDRVVSVYTSSSDGRNAFSSSSYPDYLDLRDSAALAGLAAFAGVSLSFDAGGETQAITGEMVSGNYFEVLGVVPVLGRRFVPEEDQADKPVRVAVIAHDFWMRQFGGDSSIVGGSVKLNGEIYTVIGITPRRFTSPVLGRAPEIWVPFALQQEVRPPSAGLRRALGHANLLNVRDVRWLNMIGRLRDQASVLQASQAADVVGRRLVAAYPESNEGRGFTVVPLGEGPGVRAVARPLLNVLGAAVLLVLLIACANVAGLLVARAVSRRREVAVRVAVGAGSARLLRQWMTESILLSLLGACGGLVLAYWGAPALRSLGIPDSIALGVNIRVLAAAFGLAIASGLLFGLAPVIQTFRTNTLAALRDEGGAVATGARAARLRRGFVVVQVALSLVLLVGAGLFLRTLYNAYAVDLGYRTDGILLADINLDVRGYSQEAGQAFYRQVFEQVGAVPGVSAIGAARVSVLSGGARTTAVSTDGRPVDRGARNGMTVRANVVSDGYLRAMGVPLLQGRNFRETDRPSSPAVAIVSRSLAARLWPGGDPLGKTMMVIDSPREVVGVVPDAVYVSAIERNAPPFFYVPLSQNYESGVTLHIRAAGDPLAIIPQVRQALREIDPQVVLARPRTLTDQFGESVNDARMMAVLVGTFGAIALLLSAVGLYGVMSHLAGQRTAEIGIRLALGARPRSILAMIVREGAWLAAIGAALGLAGAYAGGRLVETQLFGVEPTDPLTFTAVLLTLLAVSLLACAVPAVRAMRVDPVVALRNG